MWFRGWVCPSPGVRTCGRPAPRAPAPPDWGPRSEGGRGGGSVRSCVNRFRGGPEEVRAVEAGRPAVVGGAVR